MTTLELATVADKAQRLAELRAERKQLLIDIQAVEGSGWEQDIKRVKKQDLPPLAEDVAAILAGKPLALGITTITVRDLQRRLKALDHAITQLAQAVGTATVARLQSEAETTVPALAAVVEEGMTLVAQLVALNPACVRCSPRSSRSRGSTNGCAVRRHTCRRCTTTARARTWPRS